MKVCSNFSEFNEKVLLVKDEKTEVLAKLDKLSQNLVDIQYLLEPADRKTVPTIPMLDIDIEVTQVNIFGRIISCLNDPILVAWGKVITKSIIFNEDSSLFTLPRCN